mmetsp:Transcript_24782/g.69033  ORF Transcript_24782/g.69033 Transcript_24782/m.69033 type:complete len:84 (+) Transcript_24782:476-727(+)
MRGVALRSVLAGPSPVPLLIPVLDLWVGPVGPAQLVPLTVVTPLPWCLVLRGCRVLSQRRGSGMVKLWTEPSWEQQLRPPFCR